MALETVVGHDSSQIGVACEENAVEIVHLSLVPVGSIEKTSDAGDGGGFVGIGLDANSGVVSDGEEVVDDLETVLAGGVVGGSDGADLGEFGSGVVLEELVGISEAISPVLTLQEGEDGDDTRRRDVDGEFILPDRELLNVFGETAHQPSSVSMHVVRLALVLVGRVDNGRL
jgi:hypothetical protein